MVRLQRMMAETSTGHRSAIASSSSESDVCWLSSIEAATCGRETWGVVRSVSTLPADLVGMTRHRSPSWKKVEDQ